MIFMLQAGGLGRLASGGSIWNPLDKDADISLSGGNLVASITSANGGIRGTQGRSSGHHYFEITVGGAGSAIHMVGLGNASATLAAYPGFDANGWSYFAADGRKYTNATDAAYGASYAAGDVIGVAYDATAGTITFYKNGASQGTAFTSISGTLYPMWGPGGSTAGTRTATLNTGATAFAYSMPAGASAWT